MCASRALPMSPGGFRFSNPTSTLQNVRSFSLVRLDYSPVLVSSMFDSFHSGAPQSYIRQRSLRLLSFTPLASRLL